MATTTVERREVADQGEQVGRDEILLIAALTMVGLGVCLYRIGQSSLWLDEAFSVAGSGDLARSWTDRGGSMGLYYTFLSVWTDADGSATWVRIPSAVFAAATVPFTYLIARMIGGWRLATMASPLLIVSWGFVRYGQEARSYSMVMMLVAVSWWLFVEIVERCRGIAWWIAYGVVTGLIGYAQPLGLMAVAPQALVLALVPTPIAAIRRMIPGLLLAGLLTVPLLVLVLRAGEAKPGWVQPLSLHQFEQLQTQLGGSVPLGAWAITVGILVGVALAAIKAARASRARWLRALPAMWFVLPIVGLISLSFVEPYFVARYLLPVSPAACILVALALQTLPRALGWVAFGALVAVMAVGVTRLWDHPRQDWTGVVEHIAAHDSSSSGILFADPELRVPFEHALIASGHDADVLPLAPPREWGELPRYLPAWSLDQVDETRLNEGVLWIVDWGHAEGSDPLGGRIAGAIDHPALAGWCVADHARFDGGLIALKTQPTTTDGNTCSELR